MKGILRSALAHLTVRFVVLQLGLILIVSLLFAAWLRIPDSGIIVVIGTVLLASLILVLAFGGEASLLRRLAGSARGGLISGAVALLVAVALWLGWSTWLDHLSANDLTRAAGYANSRFPHSLRNLFSFENLLRWLGWLWLALKWLGAGLLLAIAVPFAQASRPVLAGLRVVISFSYSMTLALTAIIVTSITQGMVEWTPGHGLRVEAISLVLRLGSVAIVDAALICFVLTVITAIVVRFEGRHAISGGTPEVNQPRSVDIP
jgi:hypothetical protein